METLVSFRPWSARSLSIRSTNVGQTLHIQCNGGADQCAARAYAIMPFVWSIGTILGPSIGGYFAEPAKSHADLFSKHGVFAKFPYLLPNLICACLMIVSIVAGYICLDETHPDMLPWNDPHPEHAEHAEAETPLFATQAGMTTSGVDLRNVESYGTFNAVDSETDELWRVKSNGQPESDTLSSDERPKALTRRVVMLVVALGIFTYHSMTYDHLLPIFFQDAKVGDMTITSAGTLAGGLGLSIQQVGLIMSINGVIALAVQAIVFPLAAAWLGVWKVFILVTVLHPIAYIVVPFLAMLPDEFVFPGIYTCLTIRNLLSILAYPVLLILIKEASPNPSSLGKLNGLAASTGAACRTIASPVAGLLYGISIRVNFTALAWWASALVAVIGAIQAFFIHQRKDGETHRVRARFMSDAGIKQDIVHIRVQDAEEEQRLLAPEA